MERTGDAMATGLPLIFHFVTKQLRFLPLKKKTHHLHFKEIHVEKE